MYSWMPVLKSKAEISSLVNNSNNFCSFQFLYKIHFFFFNLFSFVSFACFDFFFFCPMLLLNKFLTFQNSGFQTLMLHIPLEVSLMYLIPYTPHASGIHLFIYFICLFFYLWALWKSKITWVNRKLEAKKTMYEYE